MGYLDNEGLARLWGKTRAYARSAYTAGVGISIAEGAISLETPTVPITQAEYEALSEEEREGKLFLVTDAPDSIPVNVGIEDYDTEDGWHVRKYADGYVEMTHISGFSVEKSDFHDWGSAVSYDDLIAPLALPVPLLDKFYESGSIMRSVPNSLIVIPRNTAADIDRAKTSGYGVFNMNRSGLSDQISGTFSILVTGRWK